MIAAQRVMFGACAAIVASAATAQQALTAAAIPIRRLSPPEATAKERIGTINGLKQLADGRVIVNDTRAKRVLVFDPTLSTFAVSADTNGSGAALYPRSSSNGLPLYSYLGDSTPLPDTFNKGFVLFEPSGKLGRSIAHPRPTDLTSLSPDPASAAFDPKGRFIYRTNTRRAAPPPANGDRPPPPVVDSAAIVRADFDTRRIDTLGKFAVPPVLSPDRKRDGTGRLIAVTMYVNPVPATEDGWAVLSDGTLAIVRAHDYHIDWVSPDGSRTSTPKMPYDWRRLTDDDKRVKIDSMKRVFDSVAATGRPYGMTFSTRPGRGTDTVLATIQFVPLTEMLDYVPALQRGAVKADRENHLWILPTTTQSATGGGLLYDVVNKQGEVFERVQLPAGRAIAGFGPGGVVFLQHGERTGGFTLERTRIAR